MEPDNSAANTPMPGASDMAENPMMAGLLAQAQQMQEQLMKTQDEIDQTEITGSAGNGLVTIVGTGNGEPTSITIDPKVVDPQDVDTLQDLIMGALGDFGQQREALIREKMGPMADPMSGFPGL